MKPLVRNTKAFRAGTDAYVDKVDHDANPYQNGTKEHDDWNEGWACACYLAEDFPEEDPNGVDDDEAEMLGWNR